MRVILSLQRDEARDKSKDCEGTVESTVYIEFESGIRGTVALPLPTMLSCHLILAKHYICILVNKLIFYLEITTPKIQEHFSFARNDKCLVRVKYYLYPHIF